MVKAKDEAEDALVAAALAAREHAHAPYSQFHVGCAVEGKHGGIAVGANMENACYRLGVCAEQAALAAALQAFGLAQVTRVAVVGGHTDVGKQAASPVTPCGGCRQAIAEAAQLSGRDITVICCDSQGGNRVVTSIAQLLPAAFSLP